MIFVFMGIVQLFISYSYGSNNDIYQYINKNGTTVYTNHKIKNAKKVMLPPLINYYNFPNQSDSYNHNTPIKNYSYNSRNNSNNQLNRINILQEELTKETVALQDAKNTLIQALKIKLIGEKKSDYESRIKILTDTTTIHQKNISLLKNELGQN